MSRIDGRLDCLGNKGGGVMRLNVCTAQWRISYVVISGGGRDQFPLSCLFPLSTYLFGVRRL
jgi:hypothetical protein